MDDQSASLLPSRRITKTLLKTAIALHVLTVICTHHLNANENELTDETLLAFLQGYTKTSFKGDDYELTFLGAEIDYKTNLKPFDRVENLACQCDQSTQTYGLQEIVETKAAKKKWRQVIISKIKPEPFSNRLEEALANSLATEIRDDYIKFFDYLQERVVSNAREHKRDSNFQSPARTCELTKQTKGFNKNGQKGLDPPHQEPLLLKRRKGIRGSTRIRAR
jgi:hypothetical protein